MGGGMSIEAMKQMANYIDTLGGDSKKYRQAIAEAEKQELVAITITGKLGNIYSFTGDYSLKKGDKVYTSPPQRQWVGLTDEQIQRIVLEARVGEHGIGHTIARAIEAKLKEKNT